MQDSHLIELGMGTIAFLATAGWAQTNWRINQKVNCDLCKEKEKRAVTKFAAVDAQFAVITQQMIANNEENRESHNDLKRGVKEIGTAHGALNIDTQVALSELSSCIKALSKEIKGLKETNGARA